MATLVHAFNIAKYTVNEKIGKAFNNKSDYYVHIQFIPIATGQATVGGVIADIDNHTITSQDPSNLQLLIPPHTLKPEFDVPHPFDLIVVTAMAPSLNSAPQAGSTPELMEQELFLQKIYTFGEIFRSLTHVGYAPIVNQAFNREANQFNITHQNGQIYLESL